MDNSTVECLNQSDSRGSVGQSADLRTRIESAILTEDQLRVCKLSDADIRYIADAVIRELKQQWRADFGYDGYTNCETRDEAQAQVDSFNAALGDDIRDGEQAMVMHRYTTEWIADA